MLMNTQRAARLQYGPNGFRVMAPGDHVICAVTGEAIPLDRLRYWDVATQRAFVSAEVAVRALTA